MQKLEKRGVYVDINPLKHEATGAVHNTSDCMHKTIKPDYCYVHWNICFAANIIKLFRFVLFVVVAQDSAVCDYACWVVILDLTAFSCKGPEL